MCIYICTVSRKAPLHEIYYYYYEVFHVKKSHSFHYSPLGSAWQTQDEGWYELPAKTINRQPGSPPKGNS